MALLHEYRDIFAWNYTEMPGLDPRVTVHKLAVHPSVRPVKQSQRWFRPELVPEIEKEVDKLIAANFIREVKYPSWIANIVPVKKKNGQIQVCVDFCDLNKDEELAAFRTPKGIFCYKVMSFVLKNVGATYQRAMQNIFECYVDDLVMSEPRNISELKSFQGHLAYIRCFISNLAGRCQPFSRLLKKDTPFEWDESCRNTFNNIKAYLTKPPVLVAPIVDRPLLLYIAAQEKSLWHYLLAHSTNLISRADPLKYIMPRPFLSGRLAKWALLLSEFEINFVPQRAIKDQALANFLADHPVPAEWELTEEFPDEEIFLVEVLPPWEMYFDGAARRNGAGVGVMFVSPRRDLLQYSFVLTQNCSNKEAEYQAILLGLGMTIEMKLPQLNIYGDSALIGESLSQTFFAMAYSLSTCGSESKFVEQLQSTFSSTTYSTGGCMKVCSFDACQKKRGHKCSKRRTVEFAARTRLARSSTYKLSDWVITSRRCSRTPSKWFKPAHSASSMPITYTRRWNRFTQWSHHGHSKLGGWTS
ncbi:hypothetical protein H6P81_018397 [Aristolochia fimbriata]|uniref:RNase H type-1 domain-containing protein n=1 Tax=Aristolochia fimbriata TaxID=158543 RepID=A0AAV7E1Q7_ARIFI|nr:hypothetical protein H6P81_018397 [Aristolochia fimbriata]